MMIRHSEKNEVDSGVYAGAFGCSLPVFCLLLCLSTRYCVIGLLSTGVLLSSTSMSHLPPHPTEATSHDDDMATLQRRRSLDSFPPSNDA
jgi:hypothetical protein